MKPNDATHFTLTGPNMTITYWKTVKAFNMKLLEYWDAESNKWIMKFGKLPWDEIKALDN